MPIYFFSGDDIVIVTDPPFGGRTEPIAYTLRKISKIYQKLNKRNDTIPAFWIFPYFMEQHIKFSDSNFVMLDYKVEYENHNAFNNGPKGRKQGSPVRIFTTVNPRYRNNIKKYNVYVNDYNFLQLDFT